MVDDLPVVADTMMNDCNCELNVTFAVKAVPIMAAALLKLVAADKSTLPDFATPSMVTDSVPVIVFRSSMLNDFTLAPISFAAASAEL